MKKKLYILLFIPLTYIHAGIVPCEGTDCNFNHLIQMVQKFIKVAIYSFVFPLAALMFMWAGFLYLTSAGSEEKIKKAHTIFRKVAMGIIMSLLAWLIVYTIVKLLGVPEGYTLLKST